ncbi:MAG: carboxypeptidase regulatory-like domain-containing protein [Deltaproteobacteria bacterium]|nr:carboxypeptidase regulatory-like domain-containing protein [Deltaproteobacteria bacterium]
MYATSLLSVVLAANPAQATLKCATPAVTAAASDTTDARTRESAQKGVDFLARATSAWAAEHRCFGCHVQAVTLEALSVATDRQYRVPAAEFAAIRNSILHHDGGARGPNGIYHGGYPRTARTFGGAALAKYDQYVGIDLKDDLVRVGRQLLAYQRDDGAVVGDHEGRPVTTGVMQATYQAMQTWRQLYARTADTAWLAPTQKAERWVQGTARGWDALQGAVYLQDINYALLGLRAAGVSRAEETADRLIRFLLAQQNTDGGWGFSQGSSDAFATGQTVYALRLAGLGDGERAVTRGARWLVDHQQADGGWGAGGSGKAEAMWALLGLVGVDVMSVNVAGLLDGTRLTGTQALTVTAQDNRQGAVTRLELFVDDVKVAEACGNTLAHALDARALKEGRHIVDAVAHNREGRQARRRLELFTGDVFLSQLGSRFDGGATHVTLRGLAAPQGAELVLRVLAADTSARELFTARQPAQQGAMEFAWSGQDARGGSAPRGRYLAEVSFRDRTGRTLQRETLPFFHDVEEAARAQTAEVAGQLSVRGAAPAANTRVELVDDAGKVVQATTTTEAGQYRFKNVTDGKYKVRVKKDGFADAEQDIKAERAQESNASMSLK